MRPGNVAMLVSETGGVRVQVTSPALGAANIRVQGMEGRYTQLLADGLPLYGGQSSSLGLLQIPPTDLGRVEVVKGAASALYGPSALGGVINLVSRKPGDEPDAELLLNATTRNGQDVDGLCRHAAWPRPRRLGLGGLHRQRRTDLDGDGWIDIPGYDRWSIRPRLFFDGTNGAKLFATLGAMGEDRRGGTLPGRAVPDGTEYRQEQRTNRLDAGLTGEVQVNGVGTVSVRASAMAQKHRHRFGDVIENDRHRTFFAETSLAGGSKRTPSIAGLAYQRDTYRNRAFPSFDYDFAAPALFGQVEHEVSDALTLAGSARADFHSDYAPSSARACRCFTARTVESSGLSWPRLLCANPVRRGNRGGGLSRLEPLGELDAETAQTARSMLATRATGSKAASPFSPRTSAIRRACFRAWRPTASGWSMSKAQPASAAAKCCCATALRQFTLTGSYVYVDATEADDAATNRVRVPLTPRHTAGLVGMWEDHDKGRIGVEVYYTGRQRLEDNTYRANSRPYRPARAARRGRRQPPPQGLRQCRESPRHPPDPLRSARSYRRGSATGAGRSTSGRRPTASSSTAGSGLASARRIDHELG